MGFYYKWADNNAGYVKVASHSSNHAWMLNQGWQDSDKDLKAPRIRRTNAQIEKDEASDDGDSGTSDQGSVAADPSPGE